MAKASTLGNWDGARRIRGETEQMNIINIFVRRALQKLFLSLRDDDVNHVSVKAVVSKPAPQSPLNKIEKMAASLLLK